MQYCQPGHKKGETKQDGQTRRHRENVARTKAWGAEIRRQEAAIKEYWRRAIEEKLGSYDDKPL